MRTDQRSLWSPRLILGIVLIVFGGAFLLDELNVIDVDDLFRWWPLIPMAVGASMLGRGGGQGNRVFGVLLIGGGAWILLEDFGLIDLDLWDAWPLLLIGLGAWIVWNAVRGRDASFAAAPPQRPGGISSAAAGPVGAAAAGPAAAAPVAGGSVAGTDTAGARPGTAERSLSIFAFMRHVERVATASDFEGADLTAIMGGCTIDLRGAGVAAEGAVIDAFAFWGGIKIIVGDDWVVTDKVLPLLGGAADTSRPTPGATKQLLVRGTAIMGGVEIEGA